VIIHQLQKAQEIHYRPASRGFSWFPAYEKSHHETVMAKFNFTANFARPRTCSFVLVTRTGIEPVLPL